MRVKTKREIVKLIGGGAAAIALAGPRIARAQAATPTDVDQYMRNLNILANMRWAGQVSDRVKHDGPVNHTFTIHLMKFEMTRGTSVAGILHLSFEQREGIRYKMTMALRGHFGRDGVANVPDNLPAYLMIDKTEAVYPEDEWTRTETMKSDGNPVDGYNGNPFRYMFPKLRGKLYLRYWDNKMTFATSDFAIDGNGISMWNDVVEGMDVYDCSMKVVEA
jgi:hypothetical protein